jgi:hypothetical protein
VTSLIIEPVVGWRAWLIRAAAKIEHRQVTALWQQGIVWPSGQRLQAICTTGPRLAGHDDPAPCRHHTCGIYAWKQPDDVYVSTRSTIIGEVNLWGRIIECRRGYRAQYAYPRRLYAAGEYVEWLASYFPGVSVEPLQLADLPRAYSTERGAEDG